MLSMLFIIKTELNTDLFYFVYNLPQRKNRYLLENKPKKNFYFIKDYFVLLLYIHILLKKDINHFSVIVFISSKYLFKS